MATALRKVVLVGGSGHLGPHILKALQADPAFDVTVVSRKSSTVTFPPNTNVVKVSDAYPKDEFLQAFKGHDVAVLSLNLAAEAQFHNMLVDASIEAGVKRLIPSIWGGRLDLPEACDIFPVTATKARLLEYVKSKVVSAPSWSYTAVTNGLFHDLCVQTGFYGLDPKTHSATIWDQGDNKFSVTTMETVGITVSKILQKSEATANRTVYISSFETSMNELLAAYKLGTGVSDWNISHDSVEQCIKTSQERFKTAETFMDRMRAVRPLGLLVGVKTGLGGDFVAEGLSDNELLEVPRSDVFETTAKLLKS